MYGSRQIAIEAARRILNGCSPESPGRADSRLLMDLAEMIRQRMTGEKVLVESSDPCGYRLVDWTPGASSYTAVELRGADQSGKKDYRHMSGAGIGDRQHLGPVLR